MQGYLGVLQANDALIYFVYGQVFFSLGLAIALHSHGRSRLDLASRLSWLAAFGFTHGLHEWAHLFIPVQATYLAPPSVALLNATRIALLALSFFFLGQFGSLVAIARSGPRRAVQVALLTLLVLYLAWASMLASNPNGGALLQAEAWIRRSMGFPAAALAAFALFRQARMVAGLGPSGIARDFRLAALAFAAYAILAGLVVAPQDPLATQWSVYQLKAVFLGLPAPVLRSLAGLGMVLGIMRGLRIFEVETDRRLEEAERARLESSEQARSAMEAMATTISEQREMRGLLDAALGQMIALSGSSAGWLMLVERDTGTPLFQVGRGLGGAPNPDTPCPQSEGCPCRTTMESGAASASAADGQCRLLSPDAPPGWASIPLLAHARAVGVVRLAGGELGSEKLALLASLGKQLGLAVENVQLAQEVGRKEAARAQLLRKVITAQEEERRRVARELHDQTGQSLTAVIMALGVAGERVARGPRRVSAMLEEAREVAVQALQSTRELIIGLRPAALDDLGLVPALRRFAEDLARKGSLEVSIEADGLGRRLPGDVEIVMFRVLQESLHNVLRHSQASRANIRLTRDDRRVRAEVADDGVGFDLAEATARPETGRGLGLLGMMERTALLGGSVAVQTSPGQGTRVLVELPLQENGRHE